MSPSRRQAVNFLKCAFDFGAVKIVHSKSSDKHESSLCLRVAGIDWRYIGGWDATYSERVDASIEWQFWVHEYINELVKPFLKLGKARLHPLHYSC